MFRSAFRRLLAADDPPERTALAFSVGVFIAFPPLFIIHRFPLASLRAAARISKVCRAVSLPAPPAARPKLERNL